MTDFTLEDLKTLLVECAGVDEDVDLSGDISDELFEDLGYDSLALLNTTSRIERTYGISLPDDVVEACVTPALLLEAVGEALNRAHVAA